MDIKITLKPQGFFYSLLQGDTLWGHFMWAYRFLYGEEALVVFLEQQEQSPWLVSSAFPAGYLPRPHLPAVSRGAVIEVLGEDFDPKKLKKQGYLSREQFLKLRASLSPLALLKAVYEQEEHNRSISILETHTAIDRESGSVLAHTLHQEVALDLQGAWELYCRIPEADMESFQACLQYLSDSGFGAQKSTGGGAFEYTHTEEQELFTLEGANAFFTLAPFVPQDGWDLDGRWELRTKWGKIGERTDGNLAPFKKPLLMIKEGAAFFHCDPQGRLFGQLLDHVHPARPGIRHYGFAYPVPFILEDTPS